MAEFFDVIVIGAGLSGISAGYYLQKDCPDRSYAILEMRDAIGGTWDLFRYPGIRCDSDMYSLGFPFRPWPREETIATGDKIREYIEDTAREFGIDRKIRFGHKLISANWNSETARWQLVVEQTANGKRVEFEARFVIGCTGYYNYDEGYTPEFPGREKFKGEFVHPQLWSEDIDHRGKKVVVIGSGATAVTLVPAMAETGAEVTMLQRSPSYFVTLGRNDPIAKVLRKALPEKPAFDLIRWKNTLMFMAFYQFCRRFPDQARALLKKGVQAQLGEDFDVETHFNPKYEPWDERVCFVPDGDFFKSLRSGKAEIVTDTIETFTEKGIRLSSGRELEADMVVSATGLNVVMLGGASATIDGEPFEPSTKYFYRGAMFDDVPNFALVVGYTNATWTLKVDLVHQYVCRILNYMREREFDEVRPMLEDPDMQPRELIEMTSGYIARVRDQLPKNGSKMPWKLYQNYILDRVMLKRARLDDGALRFSRRNAEGRRRAA